MELIVQLLYKRISGEALTAEETTDLDEWLSRSRHNQAVLDEVSDQQQLATAMRRVYSFDKERIWKKVNRQRPSVFKKALAYAAAVILLVSVATWLLLPDKPAPKQTTEALPGSDKAILTLADGSTVVLDSNGNKVFEHARQQNGELIYSASKDVSYNTLSTPRGGQFKLTLPDGSRVWLNAASSLRFPTAFTGKERNVILQGEAYFEVAKNAGQPFVVVANKMTVKALGTEFNINVYDDEDAVRTTLLEGKVSTYAKASADEAVILQPGQQAVLIADSLTINAPDTDQVIAWKEGQFYFNNTPLPVILRQFARWYNVEVVYEGPVVQRKFYGIISRQAPLSTVLRMLQKNDIHFRIEGNKLYVQAG